MGDLRNSLEEIRSHPINVKKAKRFLKSRNNIKPIRGVFYTKCVGDIVMNYLVANKNMRMDANEWIDVYHMVVPVCYMDFLLVDKRWHNFITQYLPFKPPHVANVYSKRQIGKFINDLSLY